MDHSLASTTWPAAAISAQHLWRLPVQAIFVGTTGSTSAIERARTALELAYPYLPSPPSTIGEFSAQTNRTTLEYEQLAEVVILVSLVIAGCTLAVSVAAGLTYRKRLFSLLRLTGAPLSVLRRVVALESAAPLLVTAVVSTGLGFLAAGLFVSAHSGTRSSRREPSTTSSCSPGSPPPSGSSPPPSPCWTGSPDRKPPATSNQAAHPAGPGHRDRSGRLVSPAAEEPCVAAA